MLANASICFVPAKTHRAKVCLFGSPFWTRPTPGTKSVNYFKGNLEQTSSLVKQSCCLCLGFGVLQPRAPRRACARTSCSSAMPLPGPGRGSVTPAAAGQLDVRSGCLRARYPSLRPLGALVCGAAQLAYVVTEAHSTEVFQSHLLFTPRQTKILTQASLQLTALVSLPPPSRLWDLNRGPWDLMNPHPQSIFPSRLLRSHTFGE